MDNPHGVASRLGMKSLISTSTKKISRDFEEDFRLILTIGRFITGFRL